MTSSSSPSPFISLKMEPATSKETEEVLGLEMYLQPPPDHVLRRPTPFIKEHLLKQEKLFFLLEYGDHIFVVFTKCPIKPGEHRYWVVPNASPAAYVDVLFDEGETTLL